MQECKKRFIVAVSLFLHQPGPANTSRQQSTNTLSAWPATLLLSPTSQIVISNYNPLHLCHNISLIPKPRVPLDTSDRVVCVASKRRAGDGPHLASSSNPVLGRAVTRAGDLCSAAPQYLASYSLQFSYRPRSAGCYSRFCFCIGCPAQTCQASCACY